MSRQYSLAAGLFLWIACTYSATAQADIEAPYDSTVAITEVGANKRLTVATKEKRLQSKNESDFSILQGDLNTRRTVNTAPDTTAKSSHLVATVTIPATGDLLYYAVGVVLGKGPGPEEKWHAGYNRGSPRVLLQVNGPGTSDDYIAMGANPEALTVTVAGGNSGQKYDVKLTSEGNGVPAGTVWFGNNKTTTTGSIYANQPIQTNLNGRVVGGVKITGSLDGDSNNSASSASVNATVVGVHHVNWQWQNTTRSGSVSATDRPIYYVPLNTVLAMQAFPDPDGTTWPSGTPKWEADTDDNSTPVSLVPNSGNASQATVTFRTVSTSTAKPATIRAKCGTSEVSFRVVVFDVEILV